MLFLYNLPNGLLGLVLVGFLGNANTGVWNRFDRMFKTSQAEVPGTLWTVVLLGTFLTMIVTVVLPPSRFNVAMVGALMLSIGLVFYFVVAMDRPFAGKESISPQPFEIAIVNMERWDSIIAPAKPD